MFPESTKNHKQTVAAMLSAIAFLLMFLEFPLPMLIPSFIKLDISDLPELLAAFALGPGYGVLVTFMKNLLFAFLHGTSSAYIGELSNFLLGAIFSWISGRIYWKSPNRKSRKDAVIGSVLGALLMGIAAVPLNYFIVYPAYVKCYGLPLDGIIGMYRSILPSVDGLLECLLIFNLPFTVMKGLICVVLCLLIYKPLSPLLHR